MEETILELKDLCKRFGGVVAVDYLNFSVETGTVTSVIGPNGAGKTTIFNLVTGFLKPTSGKIVYRGETINGCKPHLIAGKRIARTFQNVQIFPQMTVLENVMVGRHVRSRLGFLPSMFFPPAFRGEEKRIETEAMRRLEMVGIGRLAGQAAGSLPLGNQRQLEIARALAMEPEMILLDEPASGLNARETMTMGELIRKIRDMNITVVLVEHDMELVMDVSDVVNVVNFGRCIASGTPAEIQTHPEVIAAYLGE